PSRRCSRRGESARHAATSAGNAAPSKQLCWTREGNELGKGNRKSTWAVGSYPTGRSPLGLDDMSGNDGEWTSSLFSDSGSARVSRGGSWNYDDASYVRSSPSRVARGVSVAAVEDDRPDATQPRGRLSPAMDEQARADVPVVGATSSSQSNRAELWLEVTTDGETIVGPVSRDLLQRGVLTGKVPHDARVRVAHAQDWMPLGAVLDVRPSREPSVPAPSGARTAWGFSAALVVMAAVGGVADEAAR
ncbi:MAG: SUMF1/EgtB/PvdO family nonheme iron enzyme, partial [Deltaproteobacteria bacterium]|nr:SUMF1/EgtB/PvdO family nonheme iron enzyme [Deltaproteobacteria bacterium]